MKLFRKLFNRTDTILIRNNIFELWFNRRSRFYIIFIPVAIAILIPVLFITVISTVLVMAVTGLIAQKMIRKKEN